ncbi:MAG: sulfatase-like hydrolase/transferase [Bacteriovoracaceae bacterium]|nr:sulfatase-like hydrolase/transferase [Bacteriovoracaceae bacterium]
MFKPFVTQAARQNFFYFLLNLFYLVLFRIAFLFAYRSSIPENRTADLLQAFYIGCKFDMRLAALITFPLLILTLWPKFDLTKNYKVKKFFKIFSTILTVVIFLIYCVDFGFFSYVATRVNSSSTEVMENPMIALHMAWQTYPVIWMTFGLGLFAWFHYRLLSLLLAREVVLQYQYSKKVKITSTSLLLLFWIGAIYGKLAYFPLRWSEAYFSPDPFLSQFALNPVMNIIDTAKFAGKAYDKKQVEMNYELMAKYLGVSEMNKEKLSFIRKENQASKAENRPNLVIIVLESMAANKSSIFGNKLDPTPYLKKLKGESVFFSKFFTPTVSTARGIFATMTGIPDVSDSNQHSGSRNPFIVDQHTLMNELFDYERFYFLGGNANWGNIRGIFSYNVEDISIYEEGTLKSKRNDVWGISDLDLFTEANEVLKNRQNPHKPFVALIQSAGYHRPYTIPPNRGNFQELTFSAEQLENYSFKSNEELNSLRFQDYAFGQFMELAKAEKYYENTIFAIFGDHGLIATKSINVPKSMVDLRLITHHVPLLIHSPLLKPKQMDTVASQLDVFATLAKLSGVPHINKTLGRDLFSPELDKKRYAFTYSWNEEPHSIGLIDKDFYYYEGPSKQGLFRYDGENSADVDVSAENQSKYLEMKELCRAFYETAKYMLYHNPKIKE